MAPWGFDQGHQNIIGTTSLLLDAAIRVLARANTGSPRFVSRTCGKRAFPRLTLSETNSCHSSELYTNGAAPNTNTPKKTGGGFKKRSGGPTDRLMEAVRENPGLTYAKILDKALEGMKTEAMRPRRGSK